MTERMDVKAGEIVFSIGRSERPKKNKTINIDGKPVQITKLQNGKYSFTGEGVEKMNFLDTPDSVKCKDKVNVILPGKIESMTIIPGNYTTPTKITYKAADEKTN